MLKSHNLIFAALFFVLALSQPLFAQGSVTKPTGPPPGHQPMATPESEGFMGFAIESPSDFELANLFVIMHPEEMAKKKIPEGMLIMGSKKLMLIRVTLEKTQSFNYDPMKSPGIKPKVVSLKAKLVADMNAAEEMPEIPGKSSENKHEEGNYIEAKVQEKLIEGGQKISILTGSASYNGKKYMLYLNFLPPPSSPDMIIPPGSNPSGPPPAPASGQKPPMQIK